MVDKKKEVKGSIKNIGKQVSNEVKNNKKVKWQSNKKTQTKTSNTKQNKKTPPKKWSKKTYVPTWYKVGRPTKYDKRMCGYMIEMFMRSAPQIVKDKFYHKPDYRLNGTDMMIPNKNDEEQDIRWPLRYEKHKVISTFLPTFQRFCAEIWVSRRVFYQWLEKHKEFMHTHEYCRELQNAIILENTSSGLYQANFAMFLLKNDYNYKDEQWLKVTDDRDDEREKEPHELSKEELKAKLDAIRKQRKELEEESKKKNSKK